MSDPDGELVERACRGDRGAIGDLFSRYWRAARAAAFGVTGDAASAEDAAADGFREAWTGLDSLRDRTLFGPWLRAIVVRNARRVMRREHAAAAAPVEDAPDAHGGPDEALQRLETAALVRRLVGQLPQRLRQPVLLFYFEGYESDEAARFLGIPGGTFRRRLHDARGRLRLAVDRVWKGSRVMNERRRQEIERLKRALDAADDGGGEPLFQALRGTLALRPVPPELIDALLRHRQERRPARPEQQHHEAAAMRQRIRDTVNRFTGPSARVLDQENPVGSVVAAIRSALPDFEEWAFDAADVAAVMFASATPRRPIMPPGFADGRPGAFFRLTRALLPPRADGTPGTTYELLRDSATADVFRRGIAGARIGDVLDLTWMTGGAIALRDLQGTIERVAGAVLPDIPARFVPYDEPRYRSALRLQLDGHDLPAAIGGVLQASLAEPLHADAAHVRIFLETWASARLPNS